MDATVAVEQLRRFFEARPDGVVCVYLFGSTARGGAGAGSDVDVGVLLDHDPPATLEGSGVRLEGELERQLGARVDLVLLNRAPVDLIHRVLKDGILVFDRAPLERIRFEVRARNAWFDLKPILDRYRRSGGSVRG